MSMNLDNPRDIMEGICARKVPPCDESPDQIAFKYLISRCFLLFSIDIGSTPNYDRR
jgi:hypothetical protein